MASAPSSPHLAPPTRTASSMPEKSGMPWSRHPLCSTLAIMIPTGIIIATIRTALPSRGTIDYPLPLGHNGSGISLDPHENARTGPFPDLAWSTARANRL